MSPKVPLAYRLILLLLPPQFRRDFGADLGAVLVERLRDARGVAGRAWIWLIAVVDVFTSAAAEWSRVVRSRRTSVAPRKGGALDRVELDLRFALRSLRRAPAFTGTAVLVVALGVGTTTSVLAALRAVMLDELPVSDPDRVVTLALQRQPAGSVALVSEEIDALRRESRTLQDVAGVATTGAVAIPLTEGERPLVLDGSTVTANFFEVLGARPVLGRLLRSEDGVEGAGRVTVISHETWQREFGGDPAILDRRLTRTQYQDAYSIIGVAPPGLDYPVGTDYWIPTRLRSGAMHVVARLRPGAIPEAARAEFLAIAGTMVGRRSNPSSAAAATIQPLSETVVGDVKPILLAVTAAAGLLLLIACVNVGTLLLMRGTQRSGEVRVRRALGASSYGVARLFLVESALLGAAGGALGLAFATGLLRGFTVVAPAQLPRADMIGLRGTPVAIALTVTLLSVLLFGIGPAVAAGRGGFPSALRIEWRSGIGTKRRRRLRQSLVAAQVGLAVILLVGAGLLVRSLQHLIQLDLGYDADGVAVVELGFNRQDREGPAGTYAVLESVLERMRGVPGVTAASPIMMRPFMGSTGIFAARPTLEDRSETELESDPRVPLEVGGHELFSTLGIPILRGRGLLETDREGAAKVAVVSQAVAERLWPGEDPVGRRIRMVTSEPNWWTVVGVASDTRFRELREPTPTIYLHYEQLQILPAVWTVAVRTEQDLAAMLPAMSRTVRDLDPRVHVWRVRTLSDYLASGPLAQPRTSALLLSGFALAALLLAAIGLYGVMSLAVRERTHELGVRKALGASATRLRRDVLRDALTVTLAGTVAGVGAALLLSRLLVTLLFGISTTDAATLMGVCGMLLTVAVLAAYIPARRATRVDPMRALRSE